MTDQTPPPPPSEPPYSGAAASNPYAAPANPYASPTNPYAGSGPTAKTPLLSIFSLVAGILGVIGFAIVFIPIVGSILGLFFPAAAVVLGFLGKRREPQASKGLWLTGLILGFVGIAIALISLIGWIVLFAVAGNSGSYSTY